jgi:hypothetical protein
MMARLRILEVREQALRQILSDAQVALGEISKKTHLQPVACGTLLPRFPSLAKYFRDFLEWMNPK